CALMKRRRSTTRAPPSTGERCPYERREGRCFVPCLTAVPGKGLAPPAGRSEVRLLGEPLALALCLFVLLGLLLLDRLVDCLVDDRLARIGHRLAEVEVLEGLARL